jgi:pimeloyl-ACP methyl ester carboxylesterase
MHIEVNGTRLWFDVDGPALVPDGSQMRRRPTVVLVHGGPGVYDHFYFKPDFARLTGHAQVVYLDLRGHGRSAWGEAAGALPSSRSSRGLATSRGRTPQAVTGRSSPNSSSGQPDANSPRPSLAHTTRNAAAFLHTGTTSTLGTKEHDLAASRNSGLEHRAIGSAEGEANLGGSFVAPIEEPTTRGHRPEACSERL